MTDDLNVNVRFEGKPPKPPKRHFFLDLSAVFLASAIIGTVFKSSVLFGVVWAICTLLYVLQYAKGSTSEKPKTSEGDNPPPK